MNFIAKYLLFAFLIENLCTQTILFYRYTTPLFYAFLAVGLVSMFMSKNWTPVSRGRFGWMIALSFIYVFHCFVIGLEFLDRENLIYLVAKVATFFIISTSLNSNLEFYEKKGIYLYAIISGLFITQGLVLPGGEIVFDGEARSAFGFVNANALGGIATIVFGILLCEFRRKKWNKWALLICCIAVFAALASGSRSSIIVMILMFLSQYKLSFKTVSIIAAIAIVFWVFLPNVGIEVAGINRMKATISGELGNNRGAEVEAAEWMIQERPLTGWGLITENQGRAAQITMMSSHNSYLDLAKTMGIPLAIIWFLIVASVLIKYLSNMRRYHLPFDFFCVYAVCTLFKGCFEAMFAGAHEIQTNMFFVSLAVLSMRLYNVKVCK